MSNDLTQPALLDASNDEGVLFSPEERRKRYTAEQAARLDQLHTAVLMLLCSWPIEEIARHLKLSTRTVKALAGQAAEKVAGFNKDFASMLLRTGARFVGLAAAQAHQASFRDLMIGAGISMDHARELLMMGQVAGAEDLKGGELEPDRVQAALALRRMMAAGDAASIEMPAQVPDRQAAGEPGAGEGAGSGPAEAEAGEWGGGRGGGSDRAAEGCGPMDTPEGGLQAKGLLL